MSRFTSHDVMAALQELAAAHPARVGEARYRDDDGAFACIDGAILVRLGISQAELNNRCVFSQAPRRVRSRFTAKAAKLMARLQSLNDKGYRWGQMPELARRFLKHGW
ncbi:hypothetical protein AB0K21_21625 [Streptosporangium sp. NPDC049248]|uniref:hypothetical protein n=1 Tax=Streptosporangium sp. NPDC049248 TaxID=3155651 RepID=UPI00341DADB3